MWRGDEHSGAEKCTAESFICGARRSIRYLRVCERIRKEMAKWLKRDLDAHLQQSQRGHTKVHEGDLFPVRTTEYRKWPDVGFASKISGKREPPCPTLVQTARQQLRWAGLKTSFCLFNRQVR